MTKIIFQGVPNHEGETKQYGEIKIRHAIQILLPVIQATAGIIAFSDSNDRDIYSKAEESAWIESVKSEYYLRTTIFPEPGTPVYDEVGEDSKWPITGTLPYKAGQVIQELPQFPWSKPVNR